VSGGGIEFMRPWSEKIYGVPPEQVVGSSIKTEFVMRAAASHRHRHSARAFVSTPASEAISI
jgi:hypothetical protein